MQSLLNFDRQMLFLLNGSDSLFMDKLMMMLTSGYVWIPLYITLLYIVVKNNESTSQIMLTVGCAVLCVFFADGMADYLAKPYFQRLRPSNDIYIKYAVKVVNGMRAGEYSFFSAHAANTFALAVFFSLLIKEKLFTVTMIFWSLLNGYTRIYLGLHYPGDVLAGILCGCISGLVSYCIWHYIYIRISPRIHYVSTKYTLTGYSFTDVRILVIVFLSIITCAILYALI